MRASRMRKFPWHKDTYTRIARATGKEIAMAAKAIKWIAGALASGLSVYSAIITICQHNGLQLDGVFAWSAANSIWLSPLSAFALGCFVSWQFKEWWTTTAKGKRRVTRRSASELPDAAKAALAIAHKKEMPIDEKSSAGLKAEAIPLLAESGLLEPVDVAGKTKWIIPRNAKTYIDKHSDIQKTLSSALSEAADAAAQEKRTLEQAEQEIRYLNGIDKFAGEDYALKALASCLVEQHNVEMTADEFQILEDRLTPFFGQLIWPETTDADNRRCIRLKPDARAMFEHFPSSLANIDWKRHAKERLRDDRRVTSVNCNGLSWSIDTYTGILPPGGAFDDLVAAGFFHDERHWVHIMHREHDVHYMYRHPREKRFPIFFYTLLSTGIACLCLTALIICISLGASIDLFASVAAGILVAALISIYKVVWRITHESRRSELGSAKK